MELYTSEKINEHLFCIRLKSGELLYLLEGNEQCALIDCGYGACHLSAYIKTLTDKPVTVFLTHGHIDHAMAAPEFENVYINEKDIPLYQSQCTVEERIGYAHAGLGTEADELSLEDYTPAEPNKKFHNLEDEMTFDVEPFHLEAYEFPGHTSGSMVFLIPEMKILILGDTCNNATFMFDEICSPLNEYKKALITIRDRLEGKFNRVLISHHVMDADVDIMNQMVEVCDEIFAGTADDLPFEFMGTNAFIAKKCNERFEREDGKFANLIYNKNKLFK